MGRNPVLLLLLSTFVASSFAINAVPSTNLSYIVVTSDVIVPDSMLSIVINLFNLTSSEGKESEECVLDLKVWSEGLLWYGSNWMIEVENTPRSFYQSLKLLVPEEASLKDKHVLIVESNSCFKFSRSIELTTERKKLLVMITTNKVVLKPGDMVLIKTIVHSQNLAPHLKPVNLSIYDSTNFPIVRWLNVTPKEGLLLKVYKLPLYLYNDNLTIVLENYKQQVNHTIVVKATEKDEEHFLVDVRVPRYLTLPSSDESKGQSLNVSVVSSLFSGVPLHGSVELHLSLDKKSGSLPPVELESGHKVISLKPDKLKELLGLTEKDSLIGHEVHVEVKVEEHNFLFAERENKSKQQMDKKEEQKQDLEEENKHEHMEGEGNEAKAKVYVTRKFVVTIVDQSHVLFFTEFTPLFFKPGLEYVGQVLLKEVEEWLPSRSEEKEVTVNVKHYSSNFRSPREEKHTLKLKTNSVGEFSFKVPTDDTKLELEALFDDQNSGKILRAELKELLPFFTKDGHFIQVLLKNKPPRIFVGEDLKFTIETTFPYFRFTYHIISESLIVESGVLEASSETTKHHFSIAIAHNVNHLLSSTRLLIGVVSPSNEVHTDSVQFYVEKPQEYPFRITTDVPKIAEPGSEVEVTIFAKPFTKVYLVALPELLVFEPKELEFRKEVASEILLRYLRRMNTPELSQFVEVFCKSCSAIPSVAPDSQRVVNDSCLLFLTDGVLAIDTNKTWPLTARKNGTLDELEHSRLQLVKEFDIELWNVDVVVGESGKENVQVNLPMESRLYTLAAFGIEPKRTIIFGVPSHLVAAPKVLASLEHPKYVVRGEEFVLEVHLYNHQDRDIMIQVTVSEKSGFKLVILDGDEDNKERKFVCNIILRPNQLEVVPIDVKSSSTAQHPLELEVEVVSDGIHNHLNSSVEIQYQGKQTISKTILLDDWSVDQSTAECPIGEMKQVKLEMPIQSQNVLVKIYGHPLGPFIEHVCSDFNKKTELDEIINLILAVNVLEHIFNNPLFETDQKEKCVESVRDSVEYLLYKRRDDGLYSFHPSAPGYLWLNTLMLDALVQLRNVVSYDKLDVVKTLKWLAEQQQADGSFVEPKSVVLIREEVEGSHNVPLTSQVVISLVEAGHYLDLPKEVEELAAKVTKKSIEYLEKVLLNGYLDKDSYSLSVGTYALKLAQSEKFLEVLMKRDKLVITEDKKKYWRVGENENAEESALSLEATSYAILTSLAMKDIFGAKPYVYYVSKHMRPNGAFGVQDTNVALRALSLFHRLHDLYHEYHQEMEEINFYFANGHIVSLRVLSPFFIGRLFFDETNLTNTNPIQIRTLGDGVLLQILLEYNEDIHSNGIRIQLED